MEAQAEIMATTMGRRGRRKTCQGLVSEWNCADWNIWEGRIHSDSSLKRLGSRGTWECYFLKWEDQDEEQVGSGMDQCCPTELWWWKCPISVLHGAIEHLKYGFCKLISFNFYWFSFEQMHVVRGYRIGQYMWKGIPSLMSEHEEVGAARGDHSFQILVRSVKKEGKTQKWMWDYFPLWL